MRRDTEEHASLRYAGPIATLLMVALTELVAHILEVGANVGVLVFLLTLVPIAYSGLKGGLPMGAASALLMAGYALHYVGDHAVLVDVSPDGWRSAGIVLVLGLGMAWSMSRIKRREDRFRDALEARARDLEARNRELTEANASLEAFGYVVSHDLKEPVRALENYLDVARTEWPGTESRDSLEKAYAANDRLSRLLHGLLDYSRTSSLHVASAPIDLEAVIASDACASQFQGTLRERGAQLVVEEPMPLVMGDEVLLCQLLGNLILNAIRHNRSPAPVVTLRATREDAERVRVVVADNGPGFPPDVLARFAQLRTSRPTTIKTGFGLVIAHRAAQRLGGSMWLENPPAGGGEVHLRLRAAPRDETRQDVATDGATRG